MNMDFVQHLQNLSHTSCKKVLKQNIVTFPRKLGVTAYLTAAGKKRESLKIGFSLFP